MTDVSIVNTLEMQSLALHHQYASLGQITSAVTYIASMSQTHLYINLVHNIPAH